jgi:flagellar export protein FliJ
MSRERVRRMGRIVEIRAGIVDRIEVDLANHVRRTAEAVARIATARDAFQAAVSAPSASRCSSADMVEAHEYRLGLRRRIETLEAQERKVRAEEETCRQALRAAKSDLKKFETLRDRIGQTLAADEQTAERKANDEFAARMTRTTP